MKLVTFSQGESTRIGAVVGDDVVDLSAACSDLPGNMVGFLEDFDRSMTAAQAAIGDARAARVPLADVKLHAPVPRPVEFIICGLNYRDHVAEGDGVEGYDMSGIASINAAPDDEQELPIFLNKQVSCVNGPYDPVVMPRVSDQLDYEGELGIVIGRQCRHVRYEDAHQVIAGFVVMNDVSTRDWQFKTPTFTYGKTFDTHGPMGPWIVTADELTDPHRLDLRTYVNDELRQSSNTSLMIFDCYRIIEILSSVFTLLPGMVISTGTCAGVGLAMKPPRFLKVGDVVRVEIDGVGVISNSIVAEPEPKAWSL
jgi:2-keto-4-pentenoate hydratase/2-oxohepta-3-ene-1,7-dioic acid hydratase in catechol pathway